MWKQRLLLAAGIVAVGAVAVFLAFRNTTASGGRLPSGANLLLITIDTLRADRVGCYGYRQAETPAIDRLAAGGTRFDRAYAHNVVTLPSHANILTGLYPVTHGIRDNNGFRMAQTTETIASLLKPLGFATAAFVGAFPVDSRFGLDRGFDIYNDSYGDATGAADFRFAERRAEDVVAPFLDWLSSRAQGTRWFGWVHLYDPHSPYSPPSPYASRFADRLYDGEIAYTDSQIGRIMAALKENGWLASTCVVLTADHGEGLGEHQEETHGIFVYEGTLRIPLIMSTPGVPPRVVRTRVRHIDLAPTILELLGRPLPGSLNGRSLRPLLTGSADVPPADSYFEAMSASLNRGWAPLRGIISGAQKYIDLPIPELYDLTTDGAEMANLVEKKPELVREMRLRLSSLTSRDVGTKRIREDPETLEKLKSLGYAATGDEAAQGHFGARDDPKRLIHLDNLLNEGVVAAGQGSFEKARGIFVRIITERPTMAVAYSHLAYVYRELGMPDKAVETIRAALSLGSDSPDLRIRLGLFLDEAGQSADAIAVLEQAVEATADNIDGLTYLGMAYDHAGQPAKALATFDRVIRDDPGNAAAYANMGAVYLRGNDLQKAIAVLEKAVSIDPNLAAAHNTMGVAMANTGNMEAAIESWRRAIAADARQFDTIYNLAILYMRLGRVAEARPYIELFVRTAPSSRYARDIEEFRRLLSAP
ncbi:MAG: sulfatase-like hydrolase/transferase [Acidobacteria bacterium]|nr:sulfatase-like hydrolase/transferase [Acidobacteriota bacterium]